MKQSEMIVLRALGALLSYPSPELRTALPEIGDTLSDSALIGPEERAALLGLVELLIESDPLWAEERYVELFDRGRATSLHLFEHVHGDTRDRGSAMIELKALYEQAGYWLTAKELPDYLPVVLEYLSCRDLDETRAMLGDCSHILRSIGEALLRRGSCYAAVFQALLAIAGEPALDRKIASSPIAEVNDIDREWMEQPAFAPADCTSSSENRSGS